MYVIATAGHVDHGKSTLIRALTGIEPDRWAEERRRGMTIDLGFAWTELAENGRIAFIDVPGHEKFAANMLAGAGQVPGAMLVVAADEGWRRQTEEHLQALTAFGVRHLLVVVSRCDLSDPADTVADTRNRLESTRLSETEIVTASAVTGDGLPAVRAALDRLVATLPPPSPTAPTRLWVDRVFTVRGAGTVVTGTLIAGSLHVGEQVQVAPSGQLAVIRGIESCKQSQSRVDAVARVAVNLRGPDIQLLGRGSALVAPGSCAAATTVDVSLTRPLSRGSYHLHLGSATVTARVRPLGGSSSRYARLTLTDLLPARLGEHGLLRDPGRREAATGIHVLDIDPPPLRRRGAAASRAGDLAMAERRGPGESIAELRGWVSDTEARMLGAQPGPATRHIGVHWVGNRQWEQWRRRLSALVTARRDDIDGLSRAEAHRQLELPAAPVLDALIESVPAVELVSGRLRQRGRQPAVDSPTEGAIRRLEQRLVAAPFAPPDLHQMAADGLDQQALAVAVVAGRLIRVSPEVYLLPDALEGAVALLAALPQPFTVAQARDALGSTRRVTIPLLQQLDASRRTRRIDDTCRTVTR